MGDIIKDNNVNPKNMREYLEWLSKEVASVKGRINGYKDLAPSVGELETNVTEILEDTTVKEFKTINKTKFITDIPQATNGFCIDEVVKGRTLQNLYKGGTMGSIGAPSTGIYVNNSYANIGVGKNVTVVNLTTRTIHPITRNMSNQSVDVRSFDVPPRGKIFIDEMGIDECIYTINVANSDGWDYDTNKEELLKGVLILEGDYTNIDLTMDFFEGFSTNIINIRTCGKNILDLNDPYKLINSNTDDCWSLVNDDYSLSVGNLNSATFASNTMQYRGVCYPVVVKPNTNYTLHVDSSVTEGQSNRFCVKVLTRKTDTGIGSLLHMKKYFPITDTGDIISNMNALSGQSSLQSGNLTFNSGDNTCICIGFYAYSWFNDSSAEMSTGRNSIKFSNIQLEEGSVATDYEKYTGTDQLIEQKLYSVGDSYDELRYDENKIIRRVTEIKLKDTIKTDSILVNNSTHIGIIGAYTNVWHAGVGTSTRFLNMRCDCIRVYKSDGDYDISQLSTCGVYSGNNIDLYFNKAFLTNKGYTADVNGIRDYINAVDPTILISSEDWKYSIEDAINIHPIKLGETSKHMCTASPASISLKYPTNTNTRLDTFEKQILKLSNCIKPTINPNLLDNGNFMVNQRGKSSYNVFQTTAYTVDRWVSHNYTSGNDGTIVEIPTYATYGNALILRPHESSTGQGRIRQYIDPFVSKSLEGQYVTVSIMLNSNCAEPSDFFNIYLADGSIGTVASTTIKGFKKSTIYSYTVKVPSLKKYLGVQISTPNRLNIRYVKLEVGTEATPFSPKPYPQELSACRFWFEQPSHLLSLTSQTNGDLFGFRFLEQKYGTSSVKFSITGAEYNNKLYKWGDQNTTVTADTSSMSVTNEGVNWFAISTKTPGITYNGYYQASCELFGN